MHAVFCLCYQGFDRQMLFRLSLETLTEFKYDFYSSPVSRILYFGDDFQAIYQPFTQNYRPKTACQFCFLTTDYALVALCVTTNYMKCTVIIHNDITMRFSEALGPPQAIFDTDLITLTYSTIISLYRQTLQVFYGK